jgi:hypothetical protein
MDYSYEILLQKIRDNPQKYLGSKMYGDNSEGKSLKRLCLFIDGYYYRCRMEEWEKETGLKASDHFDEANAGTPESIKCLCGINFAEFDYFVHAHYGRMIGAGATKVPATSLGSKGLIEQMSNSEEEAFDKYFELRDAFIAQKGGEKRAYPSI